MSNPHLTLSIFHIFIVVPLFLYVGFARGQIYPWVYQGLLGLGIMIFIYHLYKVFIKIKSHSLSAWINIIHVVAVAPILIYIGSQGYDTPRWAYEVLMMLGFSALGYHIYSIIMEVKQMTDKGGDRITN